MQDINNGVISNKKIIAELTQFIEDLSNLIIENGHTVIFLIKNKPFQINTNLLDSATSTLQTILHCVENYKLGDAHTLTRKYRDDIFLYLYFIEVNSRHDVLKKVSNKHENNIVKWFNNSLNNLHISEIIKYLASNNVIGECIQKHELKLKWVQINEKLNNYVHTNGIKYTQNKSRSVKNYNIDINQLCDMLKFITVTAIVIMILIKPYFIGSIDYINACETGQIPTEGSQYHVAPFVEKFIYKYIREFDTDLIAFIKDKVYMDI